MDGLFTGILAISGIYMPRSVYAFVVVFVMPVNAALNPIIYTFPQVVTIQVRWFYFLIKNID